MKQRLSILIVVVIASFLSMCTKEKENINTTPTQSDTLFPAIEATFGGRIDPNKLLDYANEKIPFYITKNNAPGFVMNNAKTTLGRILFYDKQLSVDHSISCSSCHLREYGFGDTAIASRGVLGGLTGRHAMRLVNVKYADEGKFFWDERAENLEDQVTRPIKDHQEMGFSSQNGRPGFDSLLKRLSVIDYYREFVHFIYGDTVLNELHIKECLSHFVRSIVSYDSKFDAGRVAASNNIVDFTNFTNEENLGKKLFMTSPILDSTGKRIGGGVNCNTCHQAPEFDIDPNSNNNGIIGKLHSSEFDITNTKAPTLRDIFDNSGRFNAPLMHTGQFNDLLSVIDHYNTISTSPGNLNLDRRLRPNGTGQRFQLTPTEKNALVTFIKTLGGKNIYIDPKWKNPFLN